MKAETSLAPTVPVSAPPTRNATPLHAPWKAAIIYKVILSINRITRRRTFDAGRPNRDAAPCDVERRLIELEAHKLAAMHLGPFRY